MNNPYATFIQEYFNRIALLNHSAYQLDHLLKFYPKEFEEKNKTKQLYGTAQYISDWTGPNENGWEINNPTGISIITNLETDRILSQECGFLYAQSFEALEKLLKNLVFEKLTKSTSFLGDIMNSKETAHFRKPFDKGKIKREKIGGGNSLFEATKIGCSPLFEDFSFHNDYNYNFEKIWAIFSVVRHSITHSKSSISKSKIIKNDKLNWILVNHFFNVKETGKDKIEIIFDYISFRSIQKKMAEFGYQFFKMYSILENLEYQIETITKSPSDSQK